MTQREQIINHYIDAYNNFDIDSMLKDLDPSIKFENVSGNTTDMTLTGLAAFREQAEKAKDWFQSRQQAVITFKHHNDQTEVEISYHAILNIDLPNGLKKGDSLNLKGRSIFRFAGDKIVAITDIS